MKEKSVKTALVKVVNEREKRENSTCESSECAIFVLASDGAGFMILGKVFVMFRKFEHLLSHRRGFLSSSPV